MGPDAAPGAEAPGGSPVAGWPPPWALAAVLAIAGLAAALRLWRLAAIPPGFHVDEAFNVLDARAVLAGWRPVFLPDNAGREVLYTYLQAGLMATLGDSLAVARLASALAGTATVLAAAWFAWQLPLARRPRVMVLTAAFTAFSYWHLHFSRFGIRAVLFPLVVTLVLGLWLRRTRRAEAGAGLAPGRRAKAELALLALLLGLAAYAHPAGRALALVPAADAAWRAWRHRDWRPMKVLALALAGAFAVALPLTLFWARYPWLFTGHAEEVAVSPTPAGLALNAVKVLAMFNLAGDPAPWRNLPGRPVFDPLGGLLFLGGLGLAWRALRQGADWAFLCLAWLLVLVLPSLLSDAAPNFSRAIGAIPVVFLFPALGLDAALAWAGRRPALASPRRQALAATALLALLGAQTANDYFGRWAPRPETALAFDADKVALARRLTAADERAGEAAAGATYLSHAMAAHATVRALAPGARGFDAGRGLVLPAPEFPSVGYLFAEPELAARRDLARWLAALGPAVTRRPTVRGGPELLSYTLPRAALARALGLPEETRPDLARFGPYLRLRDARFPGRVRPGEAITVTLVWQAIQTPDRYLNTLVHLDGLGPDGRPVGVGNADAPPLLRRDAGESSYPTDRWQAGETLVAEYPMAIAPDAPAGPAELLVGWYDPAQPSQRLEVDATGPDKRENGTVFRVGTIAVEPPAGPGGG